MATPAAALPSPTPPASGGLTRRELLVDLTLTAAALAVTLLTIGQDPGSIGVGGLALALVGTLPLLVRRRAPLAVFVVTAVASTGVNLLGYDLGPGVGPTVMVYFLARMPPAERPAITGFAVAGLFIAQVAADYGDGTWSPLPFPLLFWLIVWRGGEIVRERAERETAREDQVERDRRLAVAQERTRIARDLHDSAGHAINVILVQAGAARLLGARDPAAVRGALQTIEDVARDTIEEIDRLVGALREDDGAAAARFVGMRERAALAGGTLEAGADGGRFVVRADLPDAPERG